MMNYSKRKLISEMLENWFTVDHILFGGIPKAYLTDKEVYESYLNLKKSYCETLFEMYTLIGYTSKYADNPANSSIIKVNALNTIEEVKKLAARTLVNESKSFSKILKESKQPLEENIKRLNYSCQFESAFITNQIRKASRPNSVNDPKFILLKNCLSECKKELINFSIKYFK